MSSAETALLAGRLLATSLAVLLVPGGVFLAACGIRARPSMRLVLALTCSYAWVFVLAVVLPFLHGTIDQAIAVTASIVLGLGVVALRRRGHVRAPSLRTFRQYWPLALTIASLAALGWIVEPPVTGEEALELVSAARFADGGPITLDNTSLIPDSRPVYLFQPYQLAIGMIARASATDPLIALVKLRAVLVPLSILLVYAVLRQVTARRIQAAAGLAVVLVFVALDLATWELNSLFPFVRRGAFTSGIAVPALLALVIAATRGDDEGGGTGVRRAALGVLPVMFAASMSTHPLEMFTFLFFAGGIIASVVLGLDRAGSRRHAALAGVLILASALAYLAAHRWGVPDVAAREAAQKASLREYLGEEMAEQPLRTIAGAATEEGRELWARRLPSTITATLGIPTLAVVVRVAPAAAAWLALGLVPLGLLYLSPAGYILLSLAASATTLLDVNAHFALGGLLALAVALPAAARAALRAADAAPARFPRAAARAVLVVSTLLVAFAAGPPVVEALLALAAAHPVGAAGVAAAVGAYVLMTAAAQGRRPRAPWPEGMAVVVLAACLAVPMALGGRGFEDGMLDPGERVSVVTRLGRAIEAPPVTDWDAYYPTLGATLRPRLPVPREVVDNLRRLVPPRQVLLADPRYSCALVVVVDAYCVNPEHIYGHFFFSAQPYHDRYVRRGAGGETWHPVFNTTWPPDETERAFLEEYRPGYVLAGPGDADLIGKKLEALGVGTVAHVLGQGYVVFAREHD